MNTSCCLYCKQYLCNQEPSLKSTMTIVNAMKTKRASEILIEMNEKKQSKKNNSRMLAQYEDFCYICLQKWLEFWKKVEDLDLESPYKNQRNNDQNNLSIPIKNSEADLNLIFVNANRVLCLQHCGHTQLSMSRLANEKNFLTSFGGHHARLMGNSVNPGMDHSPIQLQNQLMQNQSPRSYYSNPIEENIKNCNNMVSTRNLLFDNMTTNSINSIDESSSSTDKILIDSILRHNCKLELNENFLRKLLFLELRVFIPKNLSKDTEDEGLWFFSTRKSNPPENIVDYLFGWKSAKVQNLGPPLIVHPKT